MARFEFTIRGNPIAKARPAFTTKGGKARCYNSQETEEGRFLVEVMTQFGGHDPLTGALAMGFEFVIKRPRSHYRTGKYSGQLKPNAPRYKVTKPDLDNYIKFAKDCCNEFVYIDDCQVVKYVGDPIKRYVENGEAPFTRLVVEELLGGSAT